MRLAVQQELDSYHKIQDEPDFQSAIIELTNKKGKWRGTATDLCKALGLRIAPKGLSQRLRKLKYNLAGIELKITTSRGKTYFTFNRPSNTTFSHGVVAQSNTEAQKHNSDAINEHDPILSLDNLPYPINFPFTWRLGGTEIVIAKIEKLTEREKEEISRRKGKRYIPVCAICGESKELTHRKNNGDVSHLICEGCAIQYVLKACELKGKEMWE